MKVDLWRDQSLALMTEPACWPLYPILPLIRSQSGQPRELGVLFDTPGVIDWTGFRATVFLGNLFWIPETFAELRNRPREVFDSFEELLEAGWRVD